MNCFVLCCLASKNGVACSWRLHWGLFVALESLHVFCCVFWKQRLRVSAGRNVLGLGVWGQECPILPYFFWKWRMLSSNSIDNRKGVPWSNSMLLHCFCHPIGLKKKSCFWQCSDSCRFRPCASRMKSSNLNLNSRRWGITCNWNPWKRGHLSTFRAQRRKRQRKDRKETSPSMCGEPSAKSRQCLKAVHAKRPSSRCRLHFSTFCGAWIGWLCNPFPQRSEAILGDSSWILYVYNCWGCKAWESKPSSD